MWLLRWAARELAEALGGALGRPACSKGKGAMASTLTAARPKSRGVILDNRPGELARVGSRPGEKGININYGYSGAEPSTNVSVLILGVADAGKTTKLLEQAAAAGATT